MAHLDPRLEFQTTRHSALLNTSGSEDSHRGPYQRHCSSTPENVGREDQWAAGGTLAAEDALLQLQVFDHTHRQATRLSWRQSSGPQTRRLTMRYGKALCISLILPLFKTVALANRLLEVRTA